MVEELKAVISAGNEIPTLKSLSDFVELSTSFLRDHGQALVEALALSDAAKWLTDNVGCNLISDDNGRWAVSTSGFQPVPEDGGFTETVSITSWVDPEEWKTSIPEAIDLARGKS